MTGVPTMRCVAIALLAASANAAGGDTPAPAPARASLPPAPVLAPRYAIRPPSPSPPSNPTPPTPPTPVAPNPTRGPTPRPTVDPVCDAAIAAATPSLDDEARVESGDAWRDDAGVGHADSLECLNALLDDEQYEKAIAYAWCALPHCDACLAPRTINVTASGSAPPYRFTPSLVNATVGEVVTISLAVAEGYHSLAFDAASGWGATDAAAAPATRALALGQLASEGRFGFSCDVTGHAAAGQTGALVVHGPGCPSLGWDAAYGADRCASEHLGLLGYAWRKRPAAPDGWASTAEAYYREAIALAPGAGGNCGARGYLAELFAQAGVTNRTAARAALRGLCAVCGAGHAAGEPAAARFELLGWALPAECGEEYGDSADVVDAAERPRAARSLLTIAVAATAGMAVALLL